MSILILGHGLAGAVLAYTLRQRGQQVVVADIQLATNASSLAAGVINPITGRRHVKSWRFEDFFPVARQTYQQIERELGVPLWYDLPIYRRLASAQDQNDWLGRTSDADYAALMSLQQDAGAWEPVIQRTPGDAIGVTVGARVDLQALRSGLQRQLEQDNCWIPQHLTDLEALCQQHRAVVCSEGWRGSLNPYFKHLDWQLAKGDRLLIRFPHIPEWTASSMFKTEIMLAPVGEGLYWAGANYEWQPEHEQPTEAGKQFILNELHRTIKVPFEVVAHDAAIRPTVKSRRPLVQASEVLPNLYIFNGLGTKGTLLAPYFSIALSEQMKTKG
jgi:glycine oxidase